MTEQTDETPNNDFFKMIAKYIILTFLAFISIVSVVASPNHLAVFCTLAIFWIIGIWASKYFPVISEFMQAEESLKVFLARKRALNSAVVPKNTWLKPIKDNGEPLNADEEKIWTGILSQFRDKE